MIPSGAVPVLSVRIRISREIAAFVETTHFRGRCRGLPRKRDSILWMFRDMRCRVTTVRFWLSETDSICVLCVGRETSETESERELNTAPMGSAASGLAAGFF